MPPKFKFSKEEIILTAINIIRAEGIEKVTARAIALKLNSSSKVIFSLFHNMDELHQEIIKYANSLFQKYVEEDFKSNKYPPYKSYGMSYIRFAKEETELFKLLFMRDRSKEDKKEDSEWKKVVEIICKSNNISYSEAELLHLEMWVCVHGIASMIATSYISLDIELISQILTDTYQGIRLKMLTEKK